MVFGSQDPLYSNSPVPEERDLVWVGEYYNGTHLSEFNFQTKAKQDINFLQRDMLIRFGLIGCDLRLYYEVPGGVFKLAGRMIEFIYKEGDKEYYLTGHNQMYNDVITFKDAEAIINPILIVSRPDDIIKQQGDLKSIINQYNFGYKTSVSFPDETAFNFKAICVIPIRVGNPHMILRLVGNRTMDGVIQIKRNGRIEHEILAPLTSPAEAIEVEWEVM